PPARPPSPGEPGSSPPGTPAPRRRCATPPSPPRPSRCPAPTAPAGATATRRGRRAPRRRRPPGSDPDQGGLDLGADDLDAPVADDADKRLAAGEEHQHGDAGDAEHRGRHRVGVDVEGGHDEALGVLLGEGADAGPLRLAGGVPLGPEPDQHRPGGLDHLGAEAGVGDGDGQGHAVARFSLGPGRRRRWQDSSGPVRRYPRRVVMVAEPDPTPPSRWEPLAELSAVLFGAPAGSGIAPLLSDGDADPGLFGPGSVTWRVAREPFLLAGGARALLMQVAHPLVAQGVVDHSDYEHDPFGRLVRTVRWLVAVTFGTTAEARAASRQVRRVHAGVRGALQPGNAT